MRKIALLVAPVVLLAGAAAAQTPASPGQHSTHPPAFPMLQTPQSVAREHKELHETLSRAAKENNEVGTAARELEHVLAPHFKREEEIATPPLGLLPALSKGPVTLEMKAALPMTRALERELPRMLREHEAIRAAVGRLRAAAQRSGEQDYVRFADALAAHSRQEEEILYPAAVLVGRYVSQSLQRRR